MICSNCGTTVIPPHNISWSSFCNRCIYKYLLQVQTSPQSYHEIAALPLPHPSELEGCFLDCINALTLEELKVLYDEARWEASGYKSATQASFQVIAIFKRYKYLKEKEPKLSNKERLKKIKDKENIY